MYNDHGKFIAPGEVRFVRLLPGPIERVWAFLTDSEKRARWFAGGPMELRAGGRVELLFRHANISPGETPPAKHQEHHDPGSTMPGKITRCEPPRLLSFTWAGETPAETSEVTFELTPEGDRVRLILTHRGLGGNRDELAGTASGWHTHLAILDAVFAGAPIPPIWATASKLETEYFPLVDEALGRKPNPIARASHRFPLSAERVFDAWIDPSLVRKWMAAAGSMKNLQRVEIDARVGGRFSFVDRRDGTDIDHVGKYLEIDRPRRLKFTWGVAGESVDESIVTINIVPFVEGCELTLTHELTPEWADYLDRTKDAWTKMLGGIASALDATAE